MPNPDHVRYATYLTSHLVGAWSGVHAFESATRTWRGTEHAAVVRDLVREITSDRDELRDLMGRLGYTPGPARKVLVRLGAVAGRLNPVNLLRSQRRAATQLELEQLISLVRAKHSLWDTLTELAAADERLDADWLRERAELAVSQEERLGTIMRSTAVRRFLPH